MSNKQTYIHFTNILKQLNCDIAFIQDPTTISLLTHYTTDPHERVLAMVVSANHSPLLFVPALEKNMAQTAEPTFTVISYQDHENPWAILTSAIREQFDSPTKWAVEKNFITLHTVENLKKEIPEIQWTDDLTPVINDLRLRKDADAIQKLKDSGTYADKAVEIGIQSLTEGITELEVIAKIEYEMKKLGITSMSFDTMVLFGDHAADPHGVPGDRKLRKNEWVLFDLGTMHNGYASDMTRTIFFGEESAKDVRHQEIFNIVKTAHDLAIQAVKPGMKASEIDAIARNYITEKGYGEYFIHRLGHGIGQSCHEFPSIMEGNDMILEEGMCFSVEPGVYIAKDYGVRVEDCLVVTTDGYELFTHFPQEVTKN